MGIVYGSMGLLMRGPRSYISLKREVYSSFMLYTNLDGRRVFFRFGSGEYGGLLVA